MKWLLLVVAGLVLLVAVPAGRLSGEGETEAQAALKQAEADWVRHPCGVTRLGLRPSWRMK